MPATTAAVITHSPYRGFAQALALFYPDALRPKTALTGPGDRSIDPTAQIEDGVAIEPGAVIGREAQIGPRHRIAAGAVHRLSRHASAATATSGRAPRVTHALVGDRVIIHAGVRIGQDGFGFAMGPRGT